MKTFPPLQLSPSLMAQALVLKFSAIFFLMSLSFVLPHPGRLVCFFGGLGSSVVLYKFLCRSRLIFLWVFFMFLWGDKPSPHLTYLPSFSMPPKTYNTFTLYKLICTSFFFSFFFYWFLLKDACFTEFHCFLDVLLNPPPLNSLYTLPSPHW